MLTALLSKIMSKINQGKRQVVRGINGTASLIDDWEIASIFDNEFVLKAQALSKEVCLILCKEARHFLYVSIFIYFLYIRAEKRITFPLSIFNLL